MKNENKLPKNIKKVRETISVPGVFKYQVGKWPDHRCNR